MPAPKTPPEAAAKPKRSRGVQTVSSAPSAPKPKPRAKKAPPVVTPVPAKGRVQRRATPKAPPVAPVKPKRAPKRFNGTREQWLEALTESYREDFKALKRPLPKVVKISCGWSSHGIRSNVIGEAWIPAASKGGWPEIFITPRYDDSVEVGAVLVHELVHAAGIRGHGADFKAAAEALGLTGRMTATRPGEEISARLARFARQVGAYPHAELGIPAALAPRKKGEGTPEAPVPGGEGEGWTSGPPKQGTRMLKVQCGSCGCVARMTRTWITDAGLPTCGCGGSMAEA